MSSFIVFCIIFGLLFFIWIILVEINNYLVSNVQKEKTNHEINKYELELFYDYIKIIELNLPLALSSFTKEEIVSLNAINKDDNNDELLEKLYAKIIDILPVNVIQVISKYSSVEYIILQSTLKLLSENAIKI